MRRFWLKQRFGRAIRPTGRLTLPSRRAARRSGRIAPPNGRAAQCLAEWPGGLVKWFDGLAAGFRQMEEGRDGAEKRVCREDDRPLRSTRLRACGNFFQKFHAGSGGFELRGGAKSSGYYRPAENLFASINTATFPAMIFSQRATSSLRKFK